MRTDRWRAFVNAVMNLGVPYNERNFLSSWGRGSFSERTLHHGELTFSLLVHFLSNHLDCFFVCFRVCLRHRSLGRVSVLCWTAERLVSIVPVLSQLRNLHHVQTTWVLFFAHSLSYEVKDCEGADEYLVRWYPVLSNSGSCQLYYVGKVK